MKLKQTVLFLIFNFLFLIYLSSCYIWWENKIPFDSDTTQTSLPELLYKEKAATSLETPEQLLVTKGEYSNSIKLRWSEVKNASSYRIERAVSKPDSEGNYALPEESDFKLLVQYNYRNSYEDIILKDTDDEIIDSSTEEQEVSTPKEYSYRYYYRISAENIGKGLESSEFTDISNPDTEGKGWLLPPPQNIKVDKGKYLDKISVSWDSIPNAKYYRIYKGEPENGFICKGKIFANKTSYVETIPETAQGKEFYYKVCAEMNTGALSAFSKTESGFTKKEGAPEPPKRVWVENGSGTSANELKICWEPVEVSEGKITYNVFKTSSIDSSYTTVFLNQDETTLSKSDSSSVTPGVYYTYYVQTVIEKDNGEKIKSELSIPTEESSGFLLSAPTVIDVTDSASAGDIILRWKPAVGSEAPYNNQYIYKVYYDNEIDGTFENEIGGISPDLASDGYYEAEVSRKSFYKISTINSSNGIESKKSETVAPNPLAPTNVIATKTSDLGGLSNYEDKVNKNGVYPVKITWSAPISEIPYGYKVYRSTSPSSSFRDITQGNIITTAESNGLFTFIDVNETARPGTYYYYKVVSVNAFEKGKNGNNPEEDTALNCAGYGAITPEAWFREYNKTVMHSQTKLTLMHKSNDMDKLGKETIYGDLSGSLAYDAHIKGLGAEIIMHYTDYADYYINNNEAFGKYFVVNGDTNTSAEMSADGKMFGIVTVTGMYPAKANYGKLEIKKGSAGGGGYLVETYDLNGKTLIPEKLVDWKVGEEGR